MKKISIFLLSLFMIIVLVSCQNSKTIKIIDENGNEVEFTLEATEDKEIVKNAIIYASSYDYSNLKKFNINGDAKFLVEDTNNKVEVNSDFNFNLDQEIGLSGNFQYQMKGNIDTEKYNQSGEAKLNYELLETDLYMDLSYKDGSSTISQKIKLPLTNNGDFVPFIDQSFDIDAVFDNLKDSKIIISDVGRKDFTIQLQLGAEDYGMIIGENFNTSSGVEVILVVDLIFDLNDGKFLSLDIKSDNSLLLNLDCKLKLKYDNIKVDKLSDSEKENYKSLSF